MRKAFLAWIARSLAEEAAAMLLGPARKHFMMSRAVAFIKTFLII